jgi:glycosyltransferase involved in cell wall biosynthesis
MAHGVAAVAVESDAARSLVADGESGRIVAADPISEFPRRALGIIEDDTLAARYGSAARARAAAEFPVARSTAALLASIERALTGKPGRG